jgi:hypothetical protein
MDAEAYLAIYSIAVGLLVLLSIRFGMLFDQDLSSRHPVLRRAWPHFLAWIAATLAVSLTVVGLGQLGGRALKIAAAILAPAALLAGSFLSVRAFSRGWAAIVLPAALLTAIWAASLALYVSYEAGWLENTGEMGNGVAFLGAVIFTPLILVVGIPAGLLAGRGGRASAARTPGC